MTKIVVARKLKDLHREEETAAAKPLNKNDAAAIQHQMNEIGNHLTQSIGHEAKGDLSKAKIHLIAAQTCTAGLHRMLNHHQKRLKKLHKIAKG